MAMFVYILTICFVGNSVGICFSNGISCLLTKIQLESRFFLEWFDELKYVIGLKSWD